ncbi:MAG: serine/threonine-protein kinase [Acidobacteriota bacterium]
MLAERYRVYDLLGRGAMGEVYEVLDLELGERVALKILHHRVQGDGEGAARFRREVRLARRISHPNVCRTFDLGVHRRPRRAASLFLTMELLQGETLDEVLKRSTPLSEERALELLEPLAEGLAAAHQAGVVHRDLKPSNIFLVQGEAGERLVISDFGLARAADRLDEAATVTRTGQIIGSPATMAPEQVQGGGVTTATDVYALGVVLYSMLAGTLPFHGDTAVRTLVQRLREPAPSILLHRPDLSPAWTRAVMRCLKRKPEDRFSDPREVAGALREDLPSLTESPRDSPGSPPEPDLSGSEAAPREGLSSSNPKLEEAPAVDPGGSSSRGARGWSLGSGLWVGGGVLGLVLVSVLLWWFAAGPGSSEGPGSRGEPVPPGLDAKVVDALEALGDLNPVAAQHLAADLEQPWSDWVRVEAARQLGDGDSAEEILRRLRAGARGAHPQGARAPGARAQQGEGQVPAEALEALESRLAHRPAEAAEAYERWMERALGWSTILYPLALSAWIEAGELDHGEELLRRREVESGSASRGWAELFFARGWMRQSEEQARSWLQGREGFDAVPASEAQMRLVLGAALLEQHRFVEALSELRAAEESFTALGNPVASAEVSSLMARALEFSGEEELALERAESALARVRDLDAPAVVAEVGAIYGDFLYHRGKYSEAEEHYRRAREQARRGRSPLAQSRALLGLGNLALLKGDAEAAQALYLDVIRLFEESGEQGRQALVLTNLARLEVQNHSSGAAQDRALDLYRRARRFARQGGDLRAEYYALKGEAAVLRSIGQYAAAADRLSAALALPLENLRYRAWLEIESANLHRLQGDLVAAREHLGSARASLGSVTEPWAQFAVRLELAWLDLFQGDFAAAQGRRSLLDASLKELQHPWAEANLGLWEGHLALELGEDSRALEAFDRCAEIYEAQAATREAGQCYAWGVVALARLGAGVPDFGVSGFGVSGLGAPPDGWAESSAESRSRLRVEGREPRWAWAQELLTRDENRSDRALLHYVEGHWAQFRGDAALAGAEFAESRRIRLELGEELAAARSLLGQARSAALAGDRATGQRFGRLATETFSRVGAEAWHRRATALVVNLEPAERAEASPAQR